MRKLLPILLCLLALVSCREERLSDDPAAVLTFSCDTLRFDTVFTEQGSATLQMMVYNRNRNALLIDHVSIADGSCFHVNIDGEQDLGRLRDIRLNGGDSLFVFVRVDINPADSDLPVLVSDLLYFHLSSGTVQSVVLEAYGQDVIRLRAEEDGKRYLTDYTFTAQRPYLLFDTLIVQGTLTIDAGATLYMHNGAGIYALGDVAANGTPESPVIIRSDRLDRLFDSVPYLYASGGWSGLFLQAEKADADYCFSYVDILSGNVGLYCYSDRTDALPTLRMDGCRIHNHALYGLVLIHTNALVTNTEISNCAAYCVYCSGGEQQFIHSTIASYFGYTNIRVQSTAKEDAAAVYINNLQKTTPQTITSFYNSIITGYLPNQLVVATPFDRYYPGTFVGNYLKTDTLQMPHAEANVYWQATDTVAVFRNTFYKYKEYQYYDFRLDSLSPAIAIGDSLTAVPYSTDRLGVSRALCKPDAGCYQHKEE